MASLALHLLIKLTEFLNFSHFSALAVMSTFYQSKTVPSSVKCIFEIAYSWIMFYRKRSVGVFHVLDFRFRILD